MCVFVVSRAQAAGRHQCSYLIQQQVNEFLQQGGDERWLDGLHSIPAKLRDLYEINKILAHRPWLITKDHIEVVATPSKLVFLYFIFFNGSLYVLNEPNNRLVNFFK